VAEAVVAPARTVTRNVASMVGARGVTALAGLVSLPVIYARLGADEFGVWAVLSGLATIVALADLGLGSAVVRQVATSRHGGVHDAAALRRTQVVLGLGVLWGAVLAVVGAIAVQATWPWLSDLLNFGRHSTEARWTAMCLMLGVLVDGLALPWRGVLEGTQRYDTLARVTAATAVLGALLATGAVLAGGGLVALAIAAAATSTVRAGWTIAVARRREPPLSPMLTGLRHEDIRDVAGYGLRVQVTSVSGAVGLELDRFILAASFSPAVAGGFELGARVVNLCRLAPVYALVALFPMAVSRTAELGPDWLDHFNVTVTKYLTAVAAIGAAVLVACADPLIRLWLGEPNRSATACITILAPAYAFNLAAGATGILSRVEGRPGRETSYAVLSVIVNLSLTWPLLHVLGPKGVPLATAIGVVVGTAHFLVSYHRATNRSVRPIVRAIWPSLVAAVVATGAGLLVRALLPAANGRLDAIVVASCCTVAAVAAAVIVLAITGFVASEDAARIRGMFGQRTSPIVHVASES